MDTIITNYLSKLEFGEPQRFKNMEIIPLFSSLDGSPGYLTLKEALEKGFLTITEVSRGGSVPELKVENRAEIPVLILDDEELVGARQNRVLNTTILLKEKSETVIPVTCTEQGRWSYVSPVFACSDTGLSSELRRRKAAHVTDSLAKSKRFEADQADMWAGIARMSLGAGVTSPTGAARDVYEARMADLNEYLGAFKCMPHQKGMLVLVNGEVAGLDLIPLESACKILHPKLVKSYAMDALLQDEKKCDKASPDRAKLFLEEAASSEEARYDSIGYGRDYRFKGKAIVGSALVHREKVVHMAFFRTAGPDKEGQISGYRRPGNFGM